MKAKKILVFLLFAFIPMIGVGVFLHFNGGAFDPAAASAASAASAEAEAADPMTGMLTAFLFSLGSMLIPLLAVVFTQLIFKEPVLKGLGISFKFNRWWWIGWLLMPVIAFAVLGVSLLMPGAHWTAEGEAVQAGLQKLPEGVGPWGLIGITVLSGLFSGATFNALFAFGEEIAWRGFLVKEFKGMSFLKMALLIGVIWGFWHFPLILNGHNYPDHPVAGVFMMVLMCLALTPILLYFRQKSGSVIVPAIMHGTFNAVVGISNMFVAPQNDLLIGGPGLAGFIVLLLVDLVLILFMKPRTLPRKQVVAAIIRKGDRIFATQRGYGEWKDWWEFPGGKIEAGETPEEALVREIREELSAEITIDKLLHTVEWDYPKFHLSMNCYLCSLKGEALQLNEHEAARWLDSAAIHSVQWLPADEQLLPLIQESLAN